MQQKRTEIHGVTHLQNVRKCSTRNIVKAGRIVTPETESVFASGLHIIRRQKMARRDKKHIVEISEDFMRDPNIKKNVAP